MKVINKRPERDNLSAQVTCDKTTSNFLFKDSSPHPLIIIVIKLSNDEVMDCYRTEFSNLLPRECLLCIYNEKRDRDRESSTGGRSFVFHHKCVIVCFMSFYMTSIVFVGPTRDIIYIGTLYVCRETSKMIF